MVVYKQCVKMEGGRKGEGMGGGGGERNRGGKACDRPPAVHPPQDRERGPVPSDRQPGQRTPPGRWR